MRELPSIASSAYATNTVNLAAMNTPFGQMGNLGAAHTLENQMGTLNAQGNPGRYIGSLIHASPPQQEKPAMGTRRLVQVLIADPNENVPLEDSLLYSGEQKLTDATDQELFFEIDIKGLLDSHNEKRIKLVDKKVKERTEHLEPAKIRDLKMVIVTVAQF